MPSDATPNPLAPLTQRALEAALTLAATRRWREVTLIEIAEAADISLSELYGVANKATLLDALEPWADAAMSAEPPETDDSPRERLFDVIMRRFEKMEPVRAGVLSLMKARDASVLRRASLLAARRRSAGWALASAGLDTGSEPELAARKLGLAWTLAQTESAWRRDDSGDFARTMAVLDRELANMDERLDRLSRFSLARKPAQTSDAASAEGEAQPEAPQAETAED